MITLKNREDVTSLIFGTLLGDGYCSPRGLITVGRKNKEYVDWFYYQLKLYCTNNGPQLHSYFEKRTQKTYYHYRFNTRSLFSEFRTLFYVFDDVAQKEVKILPKTFKDYLNPTVLAIWYLDDGGRVSDTRNSVFITLDSFSPEEALHIKECFAEIFNLETRIHRAGKSKSGKLQHRLCIPSKSYPTFHKLVYPIISQIRSLHELKLPDVWIRKSAKKQK